MAALIAWMRQRRAALHAAGRMAEARVLTACISRALKETKIEAQNGGVEGPQTRTGQHGELDKISHGSAANPH